jgi:hypothetical protein
MNKMFVFVCLLSSSQTIAWMSSSAHDVLTIGTIVPYAQGNVTDSVHGSRYARREAVFQAVQLTGVLADHRRLTRCLPTVDKRT